MKRVTICWSKVRSRHHCGRPSAGIARRNKCHLIAGHDCCWSQQRCAQGIQITSQASEQPTDGPVLQTIDTLRLRVCLRSSMCGEIEPVIFEPLPTPSATGTGLYVTFFRVSWIHHTGEWQRARVELTRTCRTLMCATSIERLTPPKTSSWYEESDINSDVRLFHDIRRHALVSSRSTALKRLNL